MTARVVNIRSGEPYDVYIGRPSIWGNPYRATIHTPRIVVIERYEAWLLQQKHLLDQLHMLKGKVLGCWCKPAACHGDVLLRLANPAETRELTALMTALIEPSDS